MDSDRDPGDRVPGRREHKEFSRAERIWKLPFYRVETEARDEQTIAKGV